MTPSRRTVTVGEPDLWVAYYGDWSGFGVFVDELAALRYAVERSMQVAKIKPGDVKEQVNR